MTEEHSVPQTDAAVDTVENNASAEATNVAQQQDVSADSSTDAIDSEKTVPLSAHIKQRKKMQQIQEERDYYKKASEHKPPVEAEDDYKKYESVTREESEQNRGKDQFETIRLIREGDWSENYPERMAIVEADLEDFLKQRPNLGQAINSAQNRYKEAWELMNALNPKQKAASKTAPKQQAPHGPGTVPKAAALNEGIDVMNMSDQEYRQWAKSKQKRR